MQVKEKKRCFWGFSAIEVFCSENNVYTCREFFRSSSERPRALEFLDLGKKTFCIICFMPGGGANFCNSSGRNKMTPKKLQPIKKNLPKKTTPCCALSIQVLFICVGDVDQNP